MNRRDLLKHSPLSVALLAGSIRSTEAQGPVVNSDSLLNVRLLGAVGDGKTVDTPAINRAIEHLASLGGGTLAFTAATYVCFTIRLKSMVDLHLSRGCTILAANSTMKGESTGYHGGSYDISESNDPWTPYQDYGHNHWRNSLFYAEDQHDFGVTGPGVIFGKGLSNGENGNL